mmetsp:Transcript_35878/g.101587  ORF Transcript_35878/g.101587 Transcript_35878/m.101587 type:complete len:184 (+) Transcript_35878:1543-2094(+)
MGVSTGGQHLEHTVAHLEDGHIEGATAKVEYKDGLVGLLLEAVGEGGSCRLVDDAQHINASNLASVLGGLALGVIEVRRHSDDSLLHLVVQELAGVIDQLAQYRGRDLLWGEVLASIGALDLHSAIVSLLDHVGHLGRLVLHLLHAASNKALHREEGVGGVNDSLTLSNLTHKPVPSLGVGDD